MKQQRNMTQTVEQDKTSEEQLSEVEIGNQFWEQNSSYNLTMIQDLWEKNGTDQ